MRHLTISLLLAVCVTGCVRKRGGYSAQPQLPPGVIAFYIAPGFATSERDAIRAGLAMWGDYCFDVREAYAERDGVITIVRKAGQVQSRAYEAGWVRWIELADDIYIQNGVREVAAHEAGHHLTGWDHLNGRAIMGSPFGLATFTPEDDARVLERTGRRPDCRR